MSKEYCLVGLGKHSINQVIPAIINSGGKLVATVSRRNIYENIANFNNLSIALSKLNKRNIIFYLATPYAIHFDQAKEIILNGFNVFIEKPALINSDQIKKLNSICPKKNFYVECFMYRYTKMYNEFLNIWKKETSQINEIDINFTIPNFPENTFRSSLDIKSVVLNDIGCYAVSLLVDLEIEALEDMKLQNDNDSLIMISSKSKSININIKIGLDDKYVNCITLKTKKEKYLFEMFFNGRKIKKNIFYKKNKLYNSFIDNNGFEEMLSLPESYWINSKKTRLDKMIKVCDIMRLIEKKI